MAASTSMGFLPVWGIGGADAGVIKAVGRWWFPYGVSDNGSVIRLKTSSDQGATWTEVGVDIASGGITAPYNVAVTPSGVMVVASYQSSSYGFSVHLWQLNSNGTVTSKRDGYPGYVHSVAGNLETTYQPTEVLIHDRPGGGWKVMMVVRANYTSSTATIAWSLNFDANGTFVNGNSDTISPLDSLDTLCFMNDGSGLVSATAPNVYRRVAGTYYIGVPSGDYYTWTAYNPAGVQGNYGLKNTSSVFDGTSLCIGIAVRNTTTYKSRVRVQKWNPSTNTITNLPDTPELPAADTDEVGGLYLNYDKATGKFLLIGFDSDNSDNEANLHQCVYTPATNSWSAWTTVDTTVRLIDPHLVNMPRYSVDYFAPIVHSNRVPGGGATALLLNKYGYNTAPGTPTLNAPSGTLNNVAPTLNATVVDPDGGNVQAYFEVSTTSNFSNIVFSGLGSTASSGTASTLKTSGLNPSTTYYWRARGYDGSAYGSNSTTASFTTSAPIVATFNYTGGAQTWVVPAGVHSVTVDAYGAEGGLKPGSTAVGGQGGRCQGPIPVTPGETLHLYVGGRGQDGLTTYIGTAVGGWNGGGSANKATSTSGPGAGGGATDVRRGGTALANRVLVAGGGGGATHGVSNPCNGGHGGGTIGQQGASGGLVGGGGGTQSAGGAASGDGFAGTLGVGGNNQQNASAGGGAGGGGYYGGGGVGASDYATGGGGGGSSLVPSGGSTSVGGRTGHGTLSISYVNTTETANTAATAPTLTTADNLAQQLRSGGQFTWTHNDANGHAQGSYAFRRTRDGVNEWWNGNTWITAETFVGSATQAVLFPSGVWPPGKYTWTVATTDSFGAPSPYATPRTVTVPGGLAMVI